MACGSSHAHRRSALVGTQSQVGGVCCQESLGLGAETGEEAVNVAVVELGEAGLRGHGGQQAAGPGKEL